MKTISLNGENYVKASLIARELGYTADYVGQLCRSGKVNAELVGRSWYVEENSIRSHKKNRYRSTAAKTKEGIQVAISSQEDDAEVEIKPTLRKSSHFYKKAHQPAQYHEDQTELIPTLTEDKEEDTPTVELSVEPADAERVKITETGEAFTISTPKLPELQLSGSLQITDEDEEEEVVVKDSKKDLQKGKKSAPKPMLRRNGAIVMHRKKTPKKRVPAPQKTTSVAVVSVHRTHYIFAQLIVALLLAVAVGAVVLSLETTMLVDGSELLSKYHFNISAVIESLK